MVVFVFLFFSFFFSCGGVRAFVLNFFFFCFQISEVGGIPLDNVEFAKVSFPVNFCVCILFFRWCLLFFFLPCFYHKLLTIFSLNVGMDLSCTSSVA